MNPDNSGTDWQDWIDTVYRYVHAKLGGDRNQNRRPERYFGQARFVHAADYKPNGDAGCMIFSIQRIDVIGHRSKQMHTKPWRCTEPSEVAREAVALYRMLGEPSDSRL